MKIKEISAWAVNMPLTAPFTSALASRTGTTRTVVRIRTEDGIVGWGESFRGSTTVAMIERYKHMIVGENPFDLERILAKLKLIPYHFGFAGYSMIGALEMACWDIMGHATNLPMARLLGGYFRTRVPATGMISRGLIRAGATDVPAELAAESQRAVGQWGFPAIKIKSQTTDVEQEVAIAKAVRRALPHTKLRLDPNGIWSVQQAVWAVAHLEETDLEYLEDPCNGLIGMAEVRRRGRVPLATNMFVVRFEEVAPAFQMEAVDVILADPAKWGGVSAVKRLAGVCETFGLGINMHSGSELGIGMAAHLHLSAALPEVRQAIDTVYYLHADDVLTQRLRLTDGHFEVPTGPGLGVQVDETKVAHYAALNQREGDIGV